MYTLDTIFVTIKKRSVVSVLAWCGLWLALGGCHQVTLVVQHVPDNTPAGSMLFVAGNFNYWDPGDQRYTLRLNPTDSTYSVTLPRGDGTMLYKFTRGDWTTVEGDRCGNYLPNRQLLYQSNDTLYVNIQSWEDLGPVACDQVVFVVDKLPRDTPPTDNIYLTGNFNGWNTRDEQYRMRRTDRGEYVVAVPRQPWTSAIEYKFTRGEWPSEEVDEYGNIIPNHYFVYGQQDSLHLQIAAWKDGKPANTNAVTLMVQIPPNTPAGDKIYLATNFNNWVARDPNFLLRKAGDGRYTINVPRKVPYMEFKFTRGDWQTVEGDPYGNERDNRSFSFGKKDTLYLQIESWQDIPPRRRGS